MKKICKNTKCNSELVNKRSNALFCNDNCRRVEKYNSDIEYKEYIKSISNKYYQKNKNNITEEYRAKDRLRSLNYYYKNKEKQNAKSVERNRSKMETNPLFKLSHNIRTLIRISMRNQFTTKSKRTIEILGCSFEEFYKHLESKFDDKMNWENQGTYWHMDHIIPISSAKTEDEVYKLNHYTNFQPLYWEDNLKKSNKLR